MATKNKLSRPKVKLWTKAQTLRLRRLYPVTDTRELATMLDRTPRAINSRAKLLKLRKRNWIKKWTAAELKQLRRLYPNTVARKLAKLFKCSKSQVYKQARDLGVKKTAEFLAEIGRNPKFLEAGKKTRYQKGQAPINKGVKGWYSGGRSSETWFKPGVRSGVAVKLWKPVGTERISKDGYLERKVSETKILQKRWKAVHIILWEQHNGPVPPGHAVAFKDRNKKNIVIENLELISRAELCRRNTIHRYPPEVKDAIRRVAGLRRRIRTMEKKANERQSKSN